MTMEIAFQSESLRLWRWPSGRQSLNMKVGGEAVRAFGTIGVVTSVSASSSTIGT